MSVEQIEQAPFFSEFAAEERDLDEADQQVDRAHQDLVQTLSNPGAPERAYSDALHTLLHARATQHRARRAYDQAFQSITGRPPYSRG